MDRHAQHTTAKILQFPAGGRASVDRRAVGTDRLDMAREPEFVRVSFGGCWYHEEAVFDPKTSRE